MRKVDIRTRTWELDMQLQRRKATPASQADERARLQQACADAGDHVMGVLWLNSGVIEACEFCHMPARISSEQLSRNLVIG